MRAMRKKQNRYRPDTVRRRKVIRKGLKVVLTLVLVFAAVASISSALAHAYYALLEAPWLRVEEIENPLTQHARYLDKLVDELAKGRKMEKILRAISPEACNRRLRMGTVNLRAGVTV